MSVYSRIMAGKEGVNGWSADLFAAATGELATGSGLTPATFYTKAQLYNRMNATALEQTQMDEIAAKYQSLNAVNQAKFLNQMRNVVKMTAHGVYNETQMNARLGITTAS